MNVKVRNGNVEQALRIFKRKITDSNKLFDYREKEFYEKPTTKRQKKKASAVARERKRQEKLAKNPLSLK
jgi:small subunit ribosomal protein S21|tara:strand:+ start:1664 stop:1873 length:210 start_codon:yes stop_codon:yes gene_type:complete